MKVVMPVLVTGIHDLKKDVDGRPAPAMTIKTRRYIFQYNPIPLTGQHWNKSAHDDFCVFLKTDKPSKVVKEPKPNSNGHDQVFRKIFILLRYIFTDQIIILQMLQFVSIYTT